jgi:hypothetical protein
MARGLGGRARGERHFKFGDGLQVEATTWQHFAGWPATRSIAVQRVVGLSPAKARITRSS